MATGRRLTTARLATAIAAGLLLAACGGGGSGGGSSRTPPTGGTTYPAVGAAPTDLPTEGPRAPVKGALVGVWVQPVDFTQPGRVAAFEKFEKLVGRPLSVAHVFRKWEQPFGTESDRSLATSDRVLMLSWSGADTRVIASGAEDVLIRTKAKEIAAFGTPILLRWRWEMDRPNLRASVWSGADYVAAWKHIRDIFRQENVTNAGWVWCPHADGFSDSSRNAASFYPGDDQVDWLCADVYAPDPSVSFADTAKPFLDWAAAHPKPIIIGEFGVQHGARTAWLSDAFAFIASRPQIKAAVYFDGFGTGNGLDHRIDQAPASLAAFGDAVASPYFSPDVRCVLAGRRAGADGSAPTSCGNAG